MPLPATWRSWLNWIGCSRGTRASVTHGERFTSSKMPRSAATKNTAPKILTREIVLALRWKICGIVEPRAERVGRATRGDAGRSANFFELTSVRRRARHRFCEIFHLLGRSLGPVAFAGRLLSHIRPP